MGVLQTCKQCSESNRATWNNVSTWEIWRCSQRCRFPGSVSAQEHFIPSGFGFPVSWITSLQLFSIILNLNNIEPMKSEIQSVKFDSIESQLTAELKLERQLRSAKSSTACTSQSGGPSQRLTEPPQQISALISQQKGQE